MFSKTKTFCFEGSALTLDMCLCEGVATRQLQGRATLGHDTLSSVATWVRKFGVATHSLVSRHG